MLQPGFHQQGGLFDLEAALQATHLTTVARPRNFGLMERNRSSGSLDELLS